MYTGRGEKGGLESFCAEGLDRHPHLRCWLTIQSLYLFKECPLLGHWVNLISRLVK